MASGSLLAQFLDFQTATGNARLTSPDKPIQLVTRHNWLWPRMWKNCGMPLQGGKQIQFWYLANSAGTFEEVLPGTPTVPKNPQLLQSGTGDWRFARVHSTNTDQEFLLNDRLKYGTRQAQFEQFVSIRDEKATIRKTDMAVGKENQLSAVPNKAFMEGSSSTGATSPYSYFAHLNECLNGLYGGGNTSGAMTVTPTGGAWTVKQTIDPTTTANNGNLIPQRQSYSSVTSDDPANIIGGMDALWDNLDWEQPDTLEKYKSQETLNNLMFLTSLQGKRAFISLMRGDQDRYVMGSRDKGSMGIQDPAYPDPQFRAIPLMRWDPLESAVIYDGASVLQTEGTAAGTQRSGPRVYAQNCNFMHPVGHEDRMDYVQAPVMHPHIPDTWVTYQTTWWQLVCKSYKHQGILRPNPTMTVGMYVTNGTGSNLY